MFGTRIHRTWRRIRQNLYQDSEHSGRRKCSFLKPDKGYRTDWESKIKQCDDWLPNRRKRICMYTFVFTNGIKSFHHHILLLFNGLLCRKMVRHAQVVVDGEYAIHFSLPEPDGAWHVLGACWACPGSNHLSVFYVLLSPQITGY